MKVSLFRGEQFLAPTAATVSEASASWTEEAQGWRRNCSLREPRTRFLAPLHPLASAPVRSETPSPPQTEEDARTQQSLSRC